MLPNVTQFLHINDPLPKHNQTCANRIMFLVVFDLADYLLPAKEKHSSKQSQTILVPRNLSLEWPLAVGSSQMGSSQAYLKSAQQPNKSKTVNSTLGNFQFGVAFAVFTYTFILDLSRLNQPNISHRYLLISARENQLAIQSGFSRVNI